MDDFIYKTKHSVFGEMFFIYVIHFVLFFRNCKFSCN